MGESHAWTNANLGATQAKGVKKGNLARGGPFKEGGPRILSTGWVKTRRERAPLKFAHLKKKKKKRKQKGLRPGTAKKLHGSHWGKKLDPRNHTNG